MESQDSSAKLLQEWVRVEEKKTFWKHIMFGWFLKNVFLDHELQEQLVKDSSLNWTIVRPSAFTDGEIHRELSTWFGPKDTSTKLKIARACCRLHC